MRRPLVALLALSLSACSLISSLGQAARSGTEVTVVSYNIRHGVGLDDRLSLSRSAAVLDQLDPDIIGLQEVDSVVGRSGHADQAALIAGILGMEHTFGAFMDFDGGRYGMAILSRYPIVSSRTIDLPPGEQEPRIALAAEIELPGGQVITAINVHFDWLSNDASRVSQARRLAAVLDTLTGPWILMGDFNDHPASRTLRVFRDLVQPISKPIDEAETFPADSPDREIDHIFVDRRGPWTLGGIEVVPDSVASDHRPVLGWWRLR